MSRAAYAHLYISTYLFLYYSLLYYMMHVLRMGCMR